MKLTHSDAFEVLLLQAEDEGRGPVLFGDGMQRVRDVAKPFLIGDKFPEIYLEFPLLGDPFLDMTLIYGELPEDAHIDSPLADGYEDMLSFCTREQAKAEEVSFGFELDCSKPDLSQAAVHFQPRSRTDLVLPFCEAVGEPERAQLYLAQDERMPENWKLSFFGLFLNRPEFPLRVCGYIGTDEAMECAADPSHLADVLAKAGFEAFDEQMLAQAAHLLAISPNQADFQLDVYPDGGLSDTFAIDVSFCNETDKAVLKSFEGGRCAKLMKQLVEWGIADDRIRHLPNMAFTRGLPLINDDGSMTKFGFSLIPGWLKVRWRNGVLQPAKMYAKMSAGPVIEGEPDPAASKEQR